MFAGLWVTDIYSKTVWVIPLKDKKGTTLTNAFQKILHDSIICKPSKIWVDKDNVFYNRSMKSFFAEYLYRNAFNT